MSDRVFGPVTEPATEIFEAVCTPVSVKKPVLEAVRPVAPETAEFNVRLISETFVAPLVAAITALVDGLTRVACEALLDVMVILLAAVSVTPVKVLPPANCRIPLGAMNPARLVEVTVEPAATLIWLDWRLPDHPVKLTADVVSRVPVVGLLPVGTTIERFLLIVVVPA